MKKCIALCVCLTLALCAVSAQAPKKILSNGDIDAFVKNMPTIDAELSALGDKYNDFFEPAMSESASPSENMATIRAINPPDEIKDILKKNGLGNNGFEKIIVITAAFGVVEMEEAFAGQNEQMQDNPEMQSYMDEAMKQLDELKASVHKDDFALVTKRRADIAGVLSASE